MVARWQRGAVNRALQRRRPTEGPPPGFFALRPPRIPPHAGDYLCDGGVPGTSQGGHLLAGQLELAEESLSHLSPDVQAVTEGRRGRYRPFNARAGQGGCFSLDKV